MKQFSFAKAAAIVIVSGVAFNFSAHAQVSSSIGDFTLERVITLAGVSANTPPNAPAQVLAGMQDGTLEMHQVFVYNSAHRTIEQSNYVVPGQSPVPFPGLQSAPIADHYIIQVDSAALSSTPGPSVVLTGHVTSNDVPTPFGDITGSIITLSFGYQGTGPAVQFGPVMETASPVYAIYSASGAGSLSNSATPQVCSGAMLKGTYMFQLSGSQPTSAGAYVPYVDSGHFAADGNGNLTVFDSGNINGSVFQSRKFPIAYVINDDCTGTFKWPGAGMDVQLSQDGRKINMVFTSPSAVVAMGSGQLQ